MRVGLVAYARAFPTAQIGVLKRCYRIAEHWLDRHEVHAFVFGRVPRDDPLVASLAHRIVLHELNGPSRTLERALRAVKPDVLVLGEAPLDGKMRMFSRIARAHRVPQVGIENYYGAWMPQALRVRWPDVAGWLLLGCFGERVPEPESRIAFAPPLLTPWRTRRGLPPRLLVLGYDRDTLALGAAVARDLGASWEATALTGHATPIAPPWLRVRGLPDERSLADHLAAAHLVVCKNGFQQMTEALATGARVLARVAGGGVEEDLLPHEARGRITYVHGNAPPARLHHIAQEALDAPPLLPTRAGAAALAAEHLDHIMGRVLDAAAVQ